MTTTIDTVRAQWPILEPIFLIRNEREYDAAVARLNDLLDEVGTDENHPLYGLLDTLGTLIEAYEAEYEPLPPVSGADMLLSLIHI